jgi:hypothetical protein
VLLDLVFTLPTHLHHIHTHPYHYKSIRLSSHLLSSQLWTRYNEIFIDPGNLDVDGRVWCEGVGEDVISTLTPTFTQMHL